MTAKAEFMPERDYEPFKEVFLRLVSIVVNPEFELAAILRRA
jgi:hypothetical protein